MPQSSHYNFRRGGARYLPHRWLEYEFLRKPTMLTAQGEGNPPPSQEEMETAQQILVEYLEHAKEMTFTGPRHMVGSDGDELDFFELAEGETITGVYLGYR